MSPRTSMLIARLALALTALCACVACGDDATSSDDGDTNGSTTSTNGSTTSTNGSTTSTNGGTTSTNGGTTSTNGGTTSTNNATSDAGDDAATNNSTVVPDAELDVAPDADAEPDVPDEPDAEPDVPDEPDEVTTAYCDCMFLNCHDVYHEVWGEDELEARNGCLAEGSVVPRAGSPQTEGDTLECRQFYCDDGFEQPELCTAAAGLDTCTP